MSQDELAVMDGGKCILQLRGVRPFLSEKFDITKHPNYKYLSDYDKKNAFDIERSSVCQAQIAAWRNIWNCPPAFARFVPESRDEAADEKLRRQEKTACEEKEGRKSAVINKNQSNFMEVHYGIL